MVVRDSFVRSIAGISLLALLMLIAIRTLRAPQCEFGDGREYVLQTQALVVDRALAINPSVRATYWNETNPFGVQLDSQRSEPPNEDDEGEKRQFGGKFGSLYLDTGGAYRYIHSWVYSLFVAPWYAILHEVSSGSREYEAFRLANIAIVFLPLVLLWRLRPEVSSLVFILIVLTSPVTPHLQFSHPEIFCLGCILLSFVLLKSRLRWCAPLFLGAAAAQNIPIVFFFPLHVWFMWRSKREQVTPKEFIRGLFAYGAALCMPLGILAYNVHVFGTWNLIAHLGQADVTYLSVRKLMAVFVSPMIGVAWYLPASWLAVVIALGRRLYADTIVTVGSVFLVAALSSSTANINSAQLSACRYAVWYLAPLYVLPFVGGAAELRNRSRASKVLEWGGLVVIGVVWWWLGTYRFLAGDVFQFSALQRARPEVGTLYRISHLHDDVEPLVENISGAEIPVAFRFWGVYVWNLGNKESLWVLSQRAMIKAPALQVRTDSDLMGERALESTFEVKSQGEGLFTLTLRPEARFERHPFYGGYLILYVPAHIEAIRSAAPTSLR